MSATKQQKISVFYDGACPLCRREIDYYRRQKGADTITWIDVSLLPRRDIVPGLSRRQALTRLHVLDDGGRLISGARAFAEIWRRLPRFRVLWTLFRVPPIAWAMERAYVLFLKLRPSLQSAAARRQCPARLPKNS